MMRLVLAITLLLSAVGLTAQGNNATIRSATGTGNTTGHIATLLVENEGSSPLEVGSATYYIPSKGQYQDYVGRIPEPVTISTGETVPIEVIGFCMDVHVPPVPNGTSIGNFNDWVAVGAGELPGSGNGADPVVLVPDHTVPGFTPTDISTIENSTGFKSGTPDVKGGFIVTYPGTDIQVDGTVDPAKNPVAFAPLFVALVQETENAAEIILNNVTFPTPFDKDPAKEAETVIQHTIWIVMGILKDREYTRDEFEDMIHGQFESKTGLTVATISEEDKEDLDNGVSAFWESFTATGVEAKVLKATEDEAGQSNNDNNR